ncbi:hypothetical protein T06_11094 [Trichinella sp. T6]|nr:hypothetical protein T06_11094 [Trichinella sp. T6]
MRTIRSEAKYDCTCLRVCGSWRVARKAFGITSSSVLAFDC